MPLLYIVGTFVGMVVNNAQFEFGLNNVPNISFSKQVIRQDQENEHLLAAKAKLAKNSRPRAALGDLGNKPSALTSKVRKSGKSKPSVSFLKFRRESKQTFYSLKYY